VFLQYISCISYINMNIVRPTFVNPGLLMLDHFMFKLSLIRSLTAAVEHCGCTRWHYINCRCNVNCN